MDVFLLYLFHILLSIVCGGFHIIRIKSVPIIQPRNDAIIVIIFFSESYILLGFSHI